MFVLENTNKYAHSTVNREMNATFNDCNVKLCGAAKFIGRMNKFVDRARIFIQIQKTIQFIESYIRAYDTLHINRREILEKNIDKSIQFVQRFTNTVLDIGLSLDSDCNEIIDNCRDFLAVYHNKQQEKRCMRRKTINNERQITKTTF